MAKRDKDVDLPDSHLDKTINPSSDIVQKTGQKPTSIPLVSPTDWIAQSLPQFIARYMDRHWWYDFEAALLLVAPAYKLDFRIFTVNLHANLKSGAGIVDVWNHPSTFPTASQPWAVFEPERFEHAWWKATDEIRVHFLSDASQEASVQILRADAVRFLLEKGLPDSAFPSEVLASSEAELLVGANVTTATKRRGPRQKFDPSRDQKALSLWNSNKGLFKSYDEFVSDPPSDIELPFKTWRAFEAAVNRAKKRNRPSQL